MALKGGDAPGVAIPDAEILSGIFHRLRQLYKEEGGAMPEQVLNMTWDYFDPDNPTPAEVAQESNGRALVDLKDADGNIILKKANCLAHLLSYVMMVQRQVVVGSSLVAGQKKATKWLTVITQIHRDWVIH